MIQEDYEHYGHLRTGKKQAHDGEVMVDEDDEGDDPLTILGIEIEAPSWIPFVDDEDDEEDDGLLPFDIWPFN